MDRAQETWRKMVGAKDRYEEIAIRFLGLVGSHPHPQVPELAQAIRDEVQRAKDGEQSEWCRALGLKDSTHPMDAALILGKRMLGEIKSKVQRERERCDRWCFLYQAISEDSPMSRYDAITSLRRQINTGAEPPEGER